MHLKTFFGWSLIFILSFLPIGAWFIFGPGMSEMKDYSTITHSLGEIFGLVGMTMFALTFILSMRLKLIEKVFNGLDKVYIVHGVLGGLALFFILLHPLFLVLKFVPSNFYLAAKYLLPSSAWSVNFGIMALLGLILLIAMTLFFKIKYEKWKFSHKFLGLVFILAVIHIFLIRMFFVTDGVFKGYYVYATIVSVVGLAGFIYTLILKERILKGNTYKVSSIKKIKNVFEISMIPEKNGINYQSGQFAFIKFKNKTLSSESHPFSIASSSNFRELKVFIKKLGDFTAQLDELKVGDKVEVEGPYGMFANTSTNKDQVWIAGGIGITPFISMSGNLSQNKKVFLIFSAQEETDFIAKEKFEELASSNKNFKCIFWNSQKKGYLTLKDVEKFVGDLKEKEFFICGPSKLKESIITSLVKNKIKRKDIHEEAFEFK